MTGAAGKQLLLSVIADNKAPFICSIPQNQFLLNQIDSQKLISVFVECAKIFDAFQHFLSNFD